MSTRRVDFSNGFFATPRFRGHLRRRLAERVFRVTAFSCQGPVEMSSRPRIGRRVGFLGFRSAGAECRAINSVNESNPDSGVEGRLRGRWFFR